MEGGSALDRTACILIGFLLDLLFGDPYFLPHPVRFMGGLISRLEKLLLKEKYSEKKKLLNGGILVALVLLVSTAIPFGILVAVYRINHYLGMIIESIMCYEVLALKGLKTESMKVYDALKEKNPEKARRAVSMIVGRDTKYLTEQGIAKAAVETVAENTSDGVIAPLFYLGIGGAVFGFFYKAVNTMDSMIGYKNDKYLYFGRAAAKLDDIFNYIPARLSAYLMIGAAFFLKYDWKNAAFIHKRDSRKHASPNSAQTESVCAGALNLCLAGDAWYFGKKYEKPTIGDDNGEIEAEDIKRANHLLYGTAILMIIIVAAIRTGAFLWLKI